MSVTESDIHPLQPADTSSPRDTLRSFLNDTERVIDKWLEAGELTDAGSYRAYSRAISTLDFNTTPDGSSRLIQTRRLLMLWEILNRLDIPAMNDIPGDHEVDEQGVTRWTIPNTSLVIKRVEEGSRAGEFLFNENTVEQLDRYYRQVKNLPSRQNNRSGVYEAFLKSQKKGTADEEQVRNRLRQVDMSNPRTTLMGFLESVNRAYIIVMDTDAALQASPPTMTQQEAFEAERIAQDLMKQAITTLDLSEIPLAQRRSVGIECALQLKEIIDRTNLPPIDSIPNTNIVKVLRERMLDTSISSGGSVRWRYPNTSIEIVEIREGDQQGYFQFSARTVSRLTEYYKRVQELPYRRDFTQIALDYQSPQVSKGFYNYYITTPGSLIPQAAWEGRLVAKLPNWAKEMYFGQTVWQWIGLVLVVLIVVAVSATIPVLLRQLVKRASTSQSQWMRIVSPVLIVIVVFLAVYFLDNTLNLTGETLGVVTNIGYTVIIFFSACIVFIFCRAVAEMMIALPWISTEGVDASLMRLSSSVIGTLFFAWVLVSGLTHIGINITPVIAGLGIGGLAVALAARPTMENIIGSFMIFWDKPYEINQRVKVLGHDGTVESIGLRSTKIRLLSGHVTSIPNEKMASLEIENIGRRPYIRRLFNVNITYETTPKKINRALEILRDILSVPGTTNADTPFDLLDEENIVRESGEGLHPNAAINQPEFPPRVYFSDLNSDSLNILVIYWYHPADYWGYLEHATWINVRIMERFNSEDIEFAFPTQMLHIAGDDKHPIRIGEELEFDGTNSSPTMIDSQTESSGAQAMQDQQFPVSDSIQPASKEKAESEGNVEGELTEAPIEDGMMQRSDEGGG